MTKNSKAKLKADIHRGFHTLASCLVEGGFVLTGGVTDDKMHFRLAAEASNIRPKARALFTRTPNSHLHEYNVVLPVAQRSVSALNEAVVRTIVAPN